MITIYKITNLINKKTYIGQTNNIEKRWYMHKFLTPKYVNNPMYSDMQKHGIDNFKLKNLCKVKTRKIAHKKEIIYIKKYNTLYPNGYNMAIGGKGANGYKYTDEQKKEHSDRMKKTYNTKKGKKIQRKKALLQNEPKTKKKIKKRLKILRSDPKYKKMKSIEQKKVWSDPELRKKISEIHKNNPGGRIKVKINGIIYESMTHAAKKLGVCLSTIRYRIKRKERGYHIV